MKIETLAEKNLCRAKNEVCAYKPAITYGVVKEIYFLNGTQREAYGIAGFSNAEEDGTATIVLSVNDITPDYNAISSLVETLNKNDVSRVHIYDIIEDFIS